MERCARPGCKDESVAWLTYDYAEQLVWLDDAPLPSGDQWGLCSAHAGRFTVPQGWSQLDRRVSPPSTPGPTPAATTPTVTTPAAATATPRKRTRTRKTPPPNATSVP